MADIHTTWISQNGKWDDPASWNNGVPNTSDHVAIFQRGAGVAPTKNLNTTDLIQEIQIGEGFEHQIGSQGNPLVIDVNRRVLHFGDGRLFWKKGAVSPWPLPDIFIASPGGAEIDSADNSLNISTFVGVYQGRVTLLPKVRIGTDVGGAQGGNGPGLIISPFDVRGAFVESQAQTISRVIVNRGTFRMMVAVNAPARVNISSGSVTLRGSLPTTEIVQSGGFVRWVATPAAILRVLHLTGGTFNGRFGAPDFTIQNGAILTPGRLLIPQQADITGLVDLRRQR